MAPRSLVLRAGPKALGIIRERGLRAEDVDVIPGASGGAKWLVLAGLDRFLFGSFLQVPRTRPVELIGSSIGSWRMACLAQRDPVAALERGHHAYIFEQRYSPRPSPAEVSRVTSAALDRILGNSGVDEIMAHPWARLHVITVRGRGLAALNNRAALGAVLATAALGNTLSRRTLALQLRRFIFHAASSESAFRSLADLPTEHGTISRENLHAVLLASGSIPLLLEGVKIPGELAGLHWDGGLIDYNLDLDFGDGEGIVFYPHFYPYVVPGWFDKSLKWRRAGARNFARTLLIAPSQDFVSRLPGKKIPDRSDFYSMKHSERERLWKGALDASIQLADELGELLASGRIAEFVEPW